jgi:hypothetical protein
MIPVSIDWVGLGALVVLSSVRYEVGLLVNWLQSVGWVGLDSAVFSMGYGCYVGFFL